MDKHPLDGWVMLVCNPVAGSGRGEAALHTLERTLKRAGVHYLSELTEGRGHATRLAGQAIAEGCNSVVAIGGDGTLFEVVNGVVPSREPGEGRLFAGAVSVGLIQTGRGSDFGRSVGIPSDWEEASARLVQGRTTPVDLGHVTYRSFGGEKQSRYFVNAAGLGFDGAVAALANRAPRLLGGTLPYLSSLFITLVRYRNKRVRISANGSTLYRGRAASVIVANGQFFGGGMKIAPDARLADGLFDLVVLGNVSKPDLVANVPRVYVGSHVTHPKVKVAQACEVEIRSPDRLLLQADGEVLGTAPARFAVVPSALRIVV